MSRYTTLLAAVALSIAAGAHAQWNWIDYDTITLRPGMLPPGPAPPPPAAGAGQDMRHIGAYCDADTGCPAGHFCNFDGDEAGVDGFCEPCLDCGEPGDGWAGCFDCGLPDEGGADCGAKCNASPDIIASDKWRIANDGTIGDHWIIAEITMYSDRDCSEEITPASVSWSATDYDSNCESDTECSLFYDGECNTSGGCCDEGSGQFAGGDSEG